MPLSEASIDGLLSRDGLRNQDSAPHSDQSKNTTQDHIQTCNQKSASLQTRVCLPFKRGKCAVGAHETYRYQEPPRGVNIRAPGHKRKSESNDDTRRDVDDKGAVRESCTHSVGNHRTNPVPGQRTKRTSERYKEVFLQTYLSLAKAGHRQSANNPVFVMNFTCHLRGEC
jgi:hypothetical protein